MEKEKSILSIKFELLSEDPNGFLISGFSAAHSHVGGLAAVTNDCTTNNCHGGNCKTGCSG